MNTPVIGIAGCGALGSLFASAISGAGMPVVIYDADTSIAEKVNHDGVSVTGNDGNVLSYPVHASSNPSILSACNPVFIFVKTYNLETCMKDITPHLAQGTVLVSLQNGIGNDIIIKKTWNDGPVVSGTTAMGATSTGPGAIRRGGSGPTVIGGPDVVSVEKVKLALDRAGFEVQITEDPQTAVWEKAVINSAINPLGAIFNLPNGMLVKNPEIVSIQHDLVAEACMVAQAMGMKLDADEMSDKTRLVCERTETNICSMLQDIRASRRTEIDSINGTIVAEGKKHGITCHTHSLITRIIRALELSGAAQQR